MNWSDHFRELKRQQPPFREPLSVSTSVRCLSDIPPEATPQQVFRLPVEVMRVDEREARNGNLCYFLQVRDDEGLRFSIVCWSSQWIRLRGRITVGQRATLAVKVPAGDYSAFTLADH
jgi:hypothetical protein